MKRIFKSLFDYEIVGEYYDRITQPNGTTTKVKRYLRKWFFVPLKKCRENRRGGRNEE
jgi:hypothetical protein